MDSVSMQGFDKFVIDKLANTNLNKDFFSWEKLYKNQKLYILKEFNCRTQYRISSIVHTKLPPFKINFPQHCGEFKNHIVLKNKFEIT